MFGMCACGVIQSVLAAVFLFFEMIVYFSAVWLETQQLAADDWRLWFISLLIKRWIDFFFDARTHTQIETLAKKKM